MGDSAGAHFHIPPEWMTVTQMSAVRKHIWVAKTTTPPVAVCFLPCAAGCQRETSAKCLIALEFIVRSHVCQSPPVAALLKIKKHSPVLPLLLRHLCNWVREEFGFSVPVLCQRHKPGHLASHARACDSRRPVLPVGSVLPLVGLLVRLLAGQVLQK